MSVCHIWLGVEASKRRCGGSGFFRTLAFGVPIPDTFRCWRTVSALALKPNIRRRICEIRLPPCCGFAVFSWMICALTGAATPVPWPWL